MNKLNAYLEGRKACVLAKDAGISTTLVSLLRKGQRSPSLATMRAIHDATGGQVSYADWAETEVSP